MIRELRQLLGPHWMLLTFTGLFAVLFGALLAYLCCALALDGRGVSVNLLVALLGTLAGWTLGTFFSPIDKEDAKRLEFAGKSVAAFLSGYVLSTLSPLISAKVELAAKDSSIVPWEQVAIASAGFLLGAMVVFVNRVYGSRSATA
jgi:hypothetical protein